jgi:uncharacterized protein (TIGR02266 family)
MTTLDTVGSARPVRVEFPIEVSFAGRTFMIREFTLNLSVGGIFLRTDHVVEPRTRGTLTFHISRWNKPFTVSAEVVRTVPPSPDPEGPPAGLGIQFIKLGKEHHDLLARMLEGVSEASVVDAIRNAVLVGGSSLQRELQHRPTDQKIAFAIRAQANEIEALIRDANPAVVLRLLDNPRLTAANVKLILQQPTLPPKVLIGIHRARKWLADEELLTLFCAHSRAPLPDVLSSMSRLPRHRLMAMERDADFHPRVRMKARELLAAKAKATR